MVELASGQWSMVGRTGFQPVVNGRTGIWPVVNICMVELASSQWSISVW
ncbi:hypothetical protein [Moorena sp. SIO4G3]|nr:hypothetical protein [Moorena sp. SIO4G3]NEO77513.1 hypothetical protein [Moorena sp. SIO4G3]